VGGRLRLARRPGVYRGVSLSELHRRFLVDILGIGTLYPLVVTGGCAVRAHGLVDRLSQDLSGRQS